MAAKLRILTTMAIFGSIGLFVRLIPLPSSQIALARAIVGTGILVLVMFCTKKKIQWSIIRKNLPLLFFSGLALGFNWIGLFEAYKYTTISVATLCYYLAPTFVVLISPILLKEKLTKHKFICAMLSLLGMVFISQVFSVGDSGPDSWIGILYGIGAAVLYASIVLMNKFLKDMSGMDSTVMQLGIASVTLLPYVLLTEDLAYTSLTLQPALLLIAVGIIHTGLAYYLYYSSIGSIRAQTFALLSYIDPVVAILCSALLLNEKMDGLQIVGAILILGSALASELIKPKEKTSE